MFTIFVIRISCDGCYEDGPIKAFSTALLIMGQTTLEEVEAFLIGFHDKMNVFDVIFLNREKNLQALLDLEMVPVKRREILKQLSAEDYYKGPTKDRENGPDLWEFGTTVNRREVYIKVHMGHESRPVICVSFHIAERPIKYPFK